MYIFKNLQVVILPLLARVAWKRLQIGRDMLLIITSYIVTSFFIGVNIDDLEWPWISKIGVLVFFFAICDCGVDFKSELRQNG